MIRFMRQELKTIEITYGYSKDCRADLKQMKFGLGVTRDKIPLFADVLSGNADDKTWNGDVIKTVKEWLTFVSPAQVIHYVEEVFLKKPERIEAFGYVMVIAVMLLNIIERRIRKNLKDEKEGVALQGRRITLTPTGTAILDVFEYVKVLAVGDGKCFQRVIPEGLTENQKRILKLCRVSENIYVSSPNALPAV